ncbi:hypothetical protein CCR75_004205 [Bremia lactucae]|uniref:Uncharacterized protein n=1 Tax=Bremia lactucae TaxID=4779 RepID=A0A976FJR7_BRELC|nr:hypothetical protein CCR75_004205 [Bremia lactucae]
MLIRVTLLLKRGYALTQQQMVNRRESLYGRNQDPVPVFKGGRGSNFESCGGSGHGLDKVLTSAELHLLTVLNFVICAIEYQVLRVAGKGVGDGKKLKTLALLKKLLKEQNRLWTKAGERFAKKKR